MLFLVLGELDPEVQLMLYTSARALEDQELEQQPRSGKAGPSGDVPDSGTPTRTRMP